MSPEASVSTTSSSSSDKSAALEALSTASAASNSASPPGGSTDRKGPGSPADEDNPFTNLTRTAEQVKLN